MVMWGSYIGCYDALWGAFEHLAGRPVLKGPNELYNDFRGLITVVLQGFTQVS